MKGYLGINFLFCFFPDPTWLSFFLYIFVEWFRQDYLIDKNKGSAIGLAGAAILEN